METHERFAGVVDDATAGLKEDPELRLDVRAELLAHLEDTAGAFAAEGMDEAESAAQALQVFGSPLDLAAELRQANTRRMKLRALLRRAIAAVLVPLAVLAAIWLGYDKGLLHIRSADLHQILDADTIILTQVSPSLFASREERARAAQLRFLVMGDEHRPAGAARYRAIWEKSPKSRAYFANYALHLYGSNLPALSKGLQHPPAMPPAELAHFEAEMRTGERLDPDNALYNYLLAAELCRAAVVDRSSWKTDPKTGKPQKVYRYEVRDAERADRAMRELRKGLAKPYYREYRTELAKEWAALLPPMRRLDDWRVLSTHLPVVSTSLPSELRQLAEFAPYYAKTLIAAGKNAEAKPLLNAWYPMARQRVTDADEYAELLSAWSFPSRPQASSVAALTALGRTAEAKAILARADRFTRSFSHWQQQHKAVADRNERLAVQYGGIMGHFAILLETPLKEADFAPERNVWYVLGDERVLAVLVLLLLALLLRSLLQFARQHLGLRQAGAAPLLLLPSAKAFARTFAFTVVLPLASFYLLTRYSGVSGREHGVEYLRTHWGVGTGYVIELCATAAVLILLPGAFAARLIRRRCVRLGVPVPPRRIERRAKVLSFLGTLGWLAIWAGAVMGWQVLYSFWLTPPTWLGVLEWGVPVMVSILLLLPRKRQSEYALYFGTVARSLVPIYAMAILLLSLAYPVLVHEETMWVSRDRLVFSRQETPGMSPLEYRSFQEMKRLVLDALGESD